MTQPHIEAFFDAPTNTISYLVGDPASRTAAVIDPVLDFDLASGVADTRSVERILAFAQEHDWRIEMVLETHAHADHLSAAPFIKARMGAWIGIGVHIRDVQRIFRPVFAMTDLKTDGSDFDRLFEDGDRFAIGALEVEILHVPGHTPADIAYRIGDAVFVGDTLFMPDYGTARADFPGGDARTLYRSIRRLLSLPEETRLFLCHDYKAPGRDDYRWETSVGEQRRSSVHIHDGIDEDAFVAMRESRDTQLPVPKLLLPSIQVNIRAGHFAEAEANGVTYLRIPVKWRNETENN
ncbi:MBL fold metallo-hydrolase [Sphingobium boeckii]|uniref:Glyoxylase-like metal-dependent hydrolase (Beta-lactamase superfamily II) n=1 Tax=Sphingobium boeckii TaxID=1082345 RepID=A0A7W9AKE6_9SPHN|nr:MBL fold metallo-hydrolase [Sphingobium boeckii]MBB5687087.1 glyoxylase-like metal-dependent hydrolase (beta-lactamase superfamily II) [Sphingobium boeckii]